MSDDVIKRSPDDPVSIEKDDSLGRWQFAQEIVDLIDGASSWPSSRIGIYGSWGTGKTSILSFIRTILEEKGCPVVSFDPWKFHSPEDLWSSFSFTISSALASDDDGKFSKSKMQEMAHKFFENKIFESAEKVIEDGDIPFSKTIKALIKGPGKQLLQSGRDKIEQKIQTLCPQKRLVVLIDDLDRTDSKLLPEILMHLRSVLDLDGIIYVLALDPKVVGAALGEMNREWADGYSFLEKIIEYPRWLPEPSEEQWKSMLLEEVGQLKEQIDHEALFTIFGCLPKNPRKLKQYLRYLAALKSKTERFGKDEINLSALYLAQLIRLEYPDTIQKILRDKELCEYIQLSAFQGSRGWDNEDKAKKKEKERLTKIETMAASMEEVQEVAKKTEFIGRIWQAATVRRLNRRIVGTLNEMRERMIKIVDTEKHLPLPKWWDSMIGKILKD